MASEGFTGEFDRERAAALATLGREYHERCEAYDRSVCTGGLDAAGDAHPANHRELGIINQHAARVQRELIERGAAQGFWPTEVRQAIRKAG